MGFSFYVSSGATNKFIANDWLFGMMSDDGDDDEVDHSVGVGDDGAIVVMLLLLLLMLLTMSIVRKMLWLVVCI